METNDKGAKISLDSVRSLFNDSFSLYQERLEVLSEIALMPALLMILGYILMYLGFPFSILGGLVLIAGVITLIFSSLAIIFSIHNNTGVDSSYRAVTKFFWPYVWIGILSLFALIGADIMLVIPALWLIVAIILRSYTLVIENRRGIDSLRQSKEYIKGYWWAVLGRTLLLIILFVIISIILQIPFGLIAGRLGGQVASMIVTVFFLPFASIFYYKIYENLRSLKPDLHAAQPSHGGFLKVSAIVGLIGAILIIIGAAFGIAYVIKHSDDNVFGSMYMDQNSNYNWHSQYQYPPSNQ
jgi:hypothetical protein